MKTATRLKTDRLTRADWLQGALDYLRQTGGSELRITRVAEFLGVTKGSFYHHFTDREELIDAVLLHWNEIHNLSVKEAIDGSTGGPRDKLRTIMQQVTEQQLTHYDLPLRAWAMDNPKVRLFMERSDRWRLDLVRTLFEALGFSGRDLEVRTQTFVTLVSLEAAMYARPSKMEMLAQIDARLDLLTRP
ncbi:MAG: TetR/AcrR family transcriptional regulator [Chromatiales bacterium]|nr:MAG: TetR/AcrR family transcriptional regulator [Chromatiales bacterium]